MAEVVAFGAAYGGYLLAGAAAVTGVTSAVISADRSRYAYNTQQDAILANQEYIRLANIENEKSRRLKEIAAYETNAYETQVAQMNEMRYGLMLEQYGMQAELYGTMENIYGQQWALKNEILDWQLSTLDWEADFRQQQADWIKEKGAIARGLYGNETAKLLAKERAKRAMAGVDIGTGSPIEVLGQLASERQYNEDIMEWETNIDFYGKMMEKQEVLNKQVEVGFSREQAGLEMQGTLAELGYKKGVNALNIQEATGMLGTAKSYTSLLKSQRTRIGQQGDIDLNLFNLGQTYGSLSASQQAGAYGSAASYAGGTGLAFNIGSSVFNSFGQYYSAKKMFSS